MALKAFVWHLGDPSGECRALRVVVAARSPTEGAKLLRQAGWHGVRSKETDEPDAEERLTALERPGVVVWRDWCDDPPYRWHDKAPT